MEAVVSTGLIVFFVGIGFLLYKFRWARWGLAGLAFLTGLILVATKHHQSAEDERLNAELNRQFTLVSPDEIELYVEPNSLYEVRDPTPSDGGLYSRLLDKDSGSNSIRVVGRLFNHSSQYQVNAVALRIVFMDCETMPATSIQGGARATQSQEKCVVIGEVKPWINLEVPPNQARDFDESVWVPYMHPKREKKATAKILAVRAIEYAK